MFPKAKVTAIYCMADDFCKEFTFQQKKYMVEDKTFSCGIKSVSIVHADALCVEKIIEMCRERNISVGWKTKKESQDFFEE